MYQNIYSFTESRMQELRKSSAQPAGALAPIGEEIRQEAANALINLGNWIKPRSQGEASQSPVGLRRAGFAS